MGVTAQHANLSPDHSNGHIAADQIQPVPVIIRTTPPGATVYIDGVNAGTTDRNGVLTVFRAPGNYKLKAELNGYEAQELPAVIVSESGPNTFSFELVRNSGTLVLKTTQDNVYLYIDNRQVNQGRFELKPGTYSVKAEKYGFISHVETINISVDQVVELAIVLRESSADIDLQVLPSNAGWAVYRERDVEKYPHYNTPLIEGRGSKRIAGLKMGDYSVIVHMDGYVQHHFQTTIKDESLQTYTVTLQAPTTIRSRYPGILFDINQSEGFDFLITDENGIGQLYRQPGTYSINSYTYEQQLISRDIITVVAGEKGDFTIPRSSGVGRLEISSSPIDAKWSLIDHFGNIVESGEGPKYLSEVQEGTYTLHTQAIGYRSQEFRFILYRNTAKKLHVIMNEGQSTPCPSNVRDASGNVYKTIMIGEQCWMAENLRTNKYRSGATIPNAITNSIWEKLTYGAWAFYDNDAMNNAKYGKLYNWYAVADSRNLCPVGWHVPTYADWGVLGTFLGDNAGFMMKSRTGWGSVYRAGSNTSGFNGLPSGTRNYDGIFESVDSFGSFWSSIQGDANAAGFMGLLDTGTYDDATGNYRTFSLASYYKNAGMSVRCLQD